MTTETTTLTTKLRTTALAIAFGFGIAVSGPVVAQVDTPAQVQAQEALEEEDEGFDWGWLGLLGLAGLAGLAKRNNTESRR